MRILLLGDKNIENYEAVLKSLDVCYDTLLNKCDLDAYDHLIIPGGIDVDPKFYGETKDPSVKETCEEWDLLQIEIVKHFIKQKKKILGICRGQQLLNVVFGGSLIQNITSDIRHTQIIPYKQDAYHDICANEGFLKELYGDNFKVNSSHHQAIKRLGEGLKVVAQASDGTIEAIEHISLPIIAVQFHPERLSLNFKKDDCVDGIEIFKEFLFK